MTQKETTMVTFETIKTGDNIKSPAGEIWRVVATYSNSVYAISQMYGNPGTIMRGEFIEGGWTVAA
jgi:hypothetical protein